MTAADLVPTGGDAVTATVLLSVPAPFHSRALLDFFAARAIPGVEHISGNTYARTLRLPHGAGRAVLTFENLAHSTDPKTPSVAGTVTTTATDPITVTAHLTAQHPSDLIAAEQHCRRLIDAEADPIAVAAALSQDPILRRAIQQAPGLRLPGSVDGPEIVFRALVGQQVSVAAARTKLARLTERIGESVDTPIPELTHLFPSSESIAALSPEDIPGPRRRAEAIIAAGADLASGALVVEPEMSRTELTHDLVSRNGIGPWTAGYVAMRVLQDRDVLLTGDLALRHGAQTLGLPHGERELADFGKRWQPFRSYAGMYLWRACPPATRKKRPVSLPPAPRQSTTQVP